MACRPNEFDQLASATSFGSAGPLIQNRNLLYSILADIYNQQGSEQVERDLFRFSTWERINARFVCDIEYSRLRSNKKSERMSLAYNSIRVANKESQGLRSLHRVANPENPIELSIIDRCIQSLADDGIAGDRVYYSLENEDRVSIAEEYITRIIPCLGDGLLSLIDGIVVLENSVESAYLNENPGAITIGLDTFQNGKHLAEAIVHEALHEKLVLIRATHVLVPESYDDMASERDGDVLVPWPSMKHPRKWSFARALAALHVYAHTTELIPLMENFDLKQSDQFPKRWNEEDLLRRASVHRMRRDWIFSQLLHEKNGKHHTPEGLQFLAWLQTLSPDSRHYKETNDGRFKFASCDGTAVPKALRNG